MICLRVIDEIYYRHEHVGGVTTFEVVFWSEDARMSRQYTFEHLVP